MTKLSFDEKKRLISCGGYLGPQHKTVRKYINGAWRVARFPILGNAKLLYGYFLKDEDPTISHRTWMLKVECPGSEIMTLSSPKRKHESLMHMSDLIEKCIIPQYFDSYHSEASSLSAITSERARVNQLMNNYPKNGCNHPFQDSFYDYLALLQSLESSILYG